MKAIVYRNYGSPDVLHYEEVEEPAVGDDQVLVRVHAASVNPYDWHFMRGTPYPFRLKLGLLAPKVTRLGVDVAGRVEAIGRNATQFKLGDEVFGTCSGAFAEYVCAPESALAIKPGNVSFAQAASVPIAGITALQGLRDRGHIQAGQQLLINGAAGGVGTFAVQIAKSFGAVVTGVCSSRNLEMVRSIGADQVVDYTREDFTRSGRRYDLFLDCIGNHSLSACRGVLKPKGIYLMVGAPSGRWIRPLPRLFALLALSRFVSQTLTMVGAKLKKEDLVVLRDLMATGKVSPVIDKCYSLREVPEAIRYLEEGHARGKVAITLEPPERN